MIRTLLHRRTVRQVSVRLGDHMDWNALGTWAAVVVALGLALREGWTRSRERRATHLLTCARILPSAMRMDDMLRDTLAESRVINVRTADVSLLLDACTTFAQRVNANGLSDFRGVADQQNALPPGMLVPLIKVLMIERMILENHVFTGSTDMTREEAVEKFEGWVEQMKSMRTSLHWIVKGAQKRMDSWQWRHPEVGPFAGKG